MRYKLRKFTPKDVNSITKYANNINIAKWLTKEFPYPYYKNHAEFFIKTISNEDPTLTFAIEIDGEAVGSIAITPQKKNNENESENKLIPVCDKQAEVGYWLAEKYWKKGIITAAIKEITNYGFKTFDIDCIFATPFIENMPSQKVLKKAGFVTDSKIRKITKNNESYEVFIFSKML
jgi:RimJ/RimL family protein N-acetyltransferase